MQKSLFKNGAITFLALILVMVLGMLWSSITGRMLAPQGLGILAVAVLYSNLLFTVGGMTFGVGTVYRMGQRKYPVETFAANGFIMAAVMGIILYALFAVSVSVFGDTLYKGIESEYLYVAAGAVICQLITYQMASVLQGMGAIREYNLVNVVRLATAVVLVLILVFFAGYGVMGAIIAFVGGFVAAAYIAVYSVWKHTQGSWRPNWGLLKKTFTDSAKLHIATIATFVYGQVGIMVVNHYLASADVGYLSLALTFSQLLFILPQTVQTVLYPHAAHATETDALRDCSAFCRHTLLWSFGGALVFALLSRPFVKLVVGEAFYPALIPMWIILFGVALSSAAQVLSALWLRKGWYWLMAASGMTVAVIGVASQLYLVPKYGIVGSAVATALTYLSGFTFIMIVHFVKVNKRIWELVILQSSDLQEYKRLWIAAMEYISGKNHRARSQRGV